MCRRKLLKKLDALYAKHDKHQKKFLKERSMLLSAIQASVQKPICFK